MSGLSVQAGRIKKNECGSDRYFDGVTLREPGVETSVHTACAVGTEMSNEEPTAANVLNASNLTLLRIRARKIRFVYERLWRCHVDGGNFPSCTTLKNEMLTMIQELMCCAITLHNMFGFSRNFVLRLNVHIGRRPRGSSATKVVVTEEKCFWNKTRVLFKSYPCANKRKLTVPLH